MLDGVAERLQLPEEAVPGTTLALWIRDEKLLAARYALAGPGHATVKAHHAAGHLTALGY